MARYLIDSSAWIHFFNQSSALHFAAVTTALKHDQVVTCGFILTEVLQGARNDREQRLLREYFDRLPYIEIDRIDYIKAATLGFSLRRKGLTIKTIDLLLIHLALREELIILHDDSDFSLAARHVPLQTGNPA